MTLFSLFFRSLFFYIFYVLSAVIAGLLACVLGPFIGLKSRLKIFSLWPRFANWLLYFFCKISVEVSGKENIPKNPYIVISNHQGQWETFYFQYFFYPVCTLLKSELLLIPLWGWGMSLLNPIAINRNKPRRALKKILVQGKARLQRGLSVLFFPEGSRMKPKEVGNYARSGFELAKLSRIKVLPVAHNSGSFCPAHKFIKFPGKIKLIIGKPFEVKGDTSILKNETEEWTRKQVKEMAD